MTKFLIVDRDNPNITTWCNHLHTTHEDAVECICNPPDGRYTPYVRQDSNVMSRLTERYWNDIFTILEVEVK